MCKLYSLEAYRKQKEAEMLLANEFVEEEYTALVKLYDRLENTVHMIEQEVPECYYKESVIDNLTQMLILIAEELNQYE